MRKSPAIRLLRLLPLCAALAMLLLLALLAACTAEEENGTSEDREFSQERASSDRSGDRSSGGSSMFPGSSDDTPEPTTGAPTPTAGGPAPTEETRDQRADRRSIFPSSTDTPPVPTSGAPTSTAGGPTPTEETRDQGSERRSIFPGSTDAAPEPTRGVPITPPPLPPDKPEGYHHGQEHGLALVQTSRKPSAEREGWVDITLNLVAVRWGGEAGSTSRPSMPNPNSVCFGGSDDCFVVKWGSTEQFVAEITPERLQSESETVGAQAVNLAVTFEVAGNADNANLYFGDNKVSVNLQGDAAAQGADYKPQPAPTPAPSGDAKTSGFFVDQEHGIAVTGVNRIFNLESPPMPEVQVDLAVLPLSDYANADSAVPPDATPGSVCFGMDGGECLRIFWGEEEQFNAILSLEAVEELPDALGRFMSGQSGQTPGEKFANARGQGAQWPLPLSVRFKMPRNHHRAVLEFGEHRIPIDIRGMRGAPVYDYTAHYSEASPGTVLYDVDGKTVVLDAVAHNSENGGMELSMTASNNSEATDFTPAFIVDAVFSKSGQVRMTGGTRSFSTEKLAPGQSASLSFIVPRVGNLKWGRAPYSSDPVKRPDGVVFRLQDEADAPSTTVTGERPSRHFVKFDRPEDEGNFWQLKTLWSRTLGIKALADGVAYGDCGRGLCAVDSATGDTLWRVHGGAKAAIGDGAVYLTRGDQLYAFDPATGNILWESQLSHRSASVMFHNGVVYAGTSYRPWSSTYYYISAFKAATGDPIFSDINVGTLDNIIIGDGVVYTRGRNSSVVAHDLATGEERWSIPGPGRRDQSVSLIATWGGAVHSVRWGGMYHSDTLRGHDVATGEALWGVSPGGNRNDFMGTSVRDGVAVTLARLNYGEKKGQSELKAIDAVTGEQLWILEGEKHYAIAGHQGGVMYVLKTVVVGGEDEAKARFHGEGSIVSVLEALDAATGNRRWKSELLGDGKNDAKIDFLAVADGVMYLGEGMYLQTILLDN